MANLSKLTSYDKADWYRGQSLMNQYPSYAEFLAYLTNPLTVPDIQGWSEMGGYHREKPAQYVKTKAEQTQKANEEWKTMKNRSGLGGYDKWFNNNLNVWAGRHQSNRVILPWWNPYENREWTLKEISGQPNDFIDAEESEPRAYHRYDFSAPESVKRIRDVPHKTTGQPTKKKYLQVAYYNPITKETEWFGYWDEYQGPRDHAHHQGYHPRPELYLTDADLDRMELMHPIMYVSGVNPDSYHDKTHPYQDDTKAGYEKHLKYSLAGLTPAKLKEHEKRHKQRSRERWQIWSKKKYTGAERPSDPTALLNVTKAIRYAQQFPQIKSLTVGATGKAKLLRKVLMENYDSWRTVYQPINLHDFGSHLADLEALSGKAMIAQTESDNAGNIKAAKSKIRKEKATIKKRQDPASIAKEVAQRMKNVQADVEADAALYIERSEKEIQKQKDWLAHKKTEMKEITDGDEAAFRSIYDRYDRDNLHAY